MGLMNFFGKQDNTQKNNMDNVYSCDICAATEIEGNNVTYWEFRRKSIVLDKGDYYVDLNTKQRYVRPQFGFFELNDEFPMNLVLLSDQLNETQENTSTRRSGR